MQIRYPSGNFVQPKLLEFNLPPPKEESTKRLGGGFSVHGMNIVGTGFSKSNNIPQSYNPYPDNQANLQKYYQILLQNSKKF